MLKTTFRSAIVLAFAILAAASIGSAPRSIVLTPAAFADDEPGAKEDPPGKDGEEPAGKDDGEKPEAKKGGEEEGKEGKEGEEPEGKEGAGGEAGQAPGKQAKPDDVQLTPEEAKELKELDEEIKARRDVSPLEIDDKGQKFVAKEVPALSIAKPPAPKTAKKSGKSKVVVPDGSRYGFVDLAQRKKRITELYDKAVAFNEKVASLTKLKEDVRTNAEKQARMLKAQRSQFLQNFQKNRCIVEQVGDPNVFLTVQTEERKLEGGEKALREALESALKDLTITKKINDASRGKKIPGYTYLCEGEDSSKTPAVKFWLRKTYFVAPKAKGGGIILVTFTCHCPKDKFDEQTEKDFEAFIQRTQFAF
jgi:hypothetical protein